LTCNVVQCVNTLLRHKSVNTHLKFRSWIQDGGLQNGGRGSHVMHFVQLRTTSRSWDKGVLTDLCLKGVLTDLCLKGVLTDLCLKGVLTDLCLTLYFKYIYLSPIISYMFRCLLQHLQVDQCFTCSKTIYFLQCCYLHILLFHIAALTTLQKAYSF
jgi:hypothetical protein